MSENEARGSVVVRGIPVPQKTNGCHMLPDALKADAARRVLAGETVAAIARDIHANGSLVGKWLRDHRSATSSPGDTPLFVQVVTTRPGLQAGANTRTALPHAIFFLETSASTPCPTEDMRIVAV